MGWYSDITTAIVATLETIPEIGRVYPYDRYITDESSFLDQFLYVPVPGEDGEIRAWMITREKIELEPIAFGNEMGTYHYFCVAGVMGLNDVNASEVTFQDLTDAVMLALDSEADYGGLVDNWMNRPPVFARVIELRQFGAALCHYCELELKLGVESNNPQT